MPLVYMLGLRHDISSAIATVAFGVGGIVVMAIVFGGKYFALLKLKSYTPKVSSETQQTGTGTGHSNVVQLLSQDMIRSMKPDEQFEYYTKVIQKYTALRLQLNSGDSSNSQMDSSPSNQINLSQGSTEDGRLQTLPQHQLPLPKLQPVADLRMTDV
jgi:hypothetical protein